MKIVYKRDADKPVFSSDKIEAGVIISIEAPEAGIGVDDTVYLMRTNSSQDPAMWVVLAGESEKGVGSYVSGESVDYDAEYSRFSVIIQNAKVVDIDRQKYALADLQIGKTYVFSNKGNQHCVSIPHGCTVMRIDNGSENFWITLMDVESGYTEMFSRSDYIMEGCFTETETELTIE